MAHNWASVCLSKQIISPEKINEFIGAFVERFVVLQDDSLDTINAAELCGGNHKLFWAAAIVSVMKRNFIEQILTEDTKDFEALGVKAVNPLKR